MELRYVYTNIGKWILFVLFVTGFSVACITDERIYFKEDRLVGQWEISKVGFVPKHSIQEKEMELQMLPEIDLYLDGQVKMYKDEHARWGQWEIHYIDVYSPHYRSADYQFISTVDPVLENVEEPCVGFIHRLNANGFQLHFPSDKGLTKYYFSKKVE